MLKTLTIKNYAIVDDVTVDFLPGLTVLTGETGAGKSILVGALSLLLGERAQTEMVRTGEDAAIVEGVFVVPPDGDEVIVRREVHRKGLSRCFINDGLVTLATLKVFGDRMGDLCGQHQHQSLLDPRAHVRFLDERAGLGDAAEAFRAAYEQLRTGQKLWDDLTRRADERKRAFELATFQAAEIRAAGLTPDEEDNLKQELNVLKNARRLIEAAERAAAVLAEDSGSAGDRIAATRKEFQTLAEVDNRLAPTVEMLDKSVALLDEIVASLHEYRGRVDFDPVRMEEIEARLVEIFELKRKYGGSCAEVLKHLDRLEVQVADHRGEDDRREELALRLDQQRKKIAADAEALSRERKQAAKKLAGEIEATLAEVGMKGAKWRAGFAPVSAGQVSVPIAGVDTPLSENGFEDIEFEIETNPGEGFKPLVKIASGGELSRVMLALKAVGQPGRDVSLLVFDEVDSGIGGTVAYSVGQQLKGLARHYQVFLISHLQQMASLADHHYKVVKEKKGRRVTTRIRLLNKAERVEEIARMMAGEKVTATTRKHAAEIITTKRRK